MTDTYERIRQGLLDQLESHRSEISDGLISWFSVKVYLNGDHPRAVWMQEEHGVNVGVCTIAPAGVDTSIWKSRK
jgi:hypothetical protein